MITVSILINGQPIFTRSAVNQGSFTAKDCKYKLDDGNYVIHNPTDGAVKLAIKMLEQIKEREMENENNSRTKWR